MTGSATKCCDNPNRQIRRKIFSNGGVHFVWQCLACGHYRDYVPQSQCKDFAEAPYVDEILRENYQAKNAERIAFEREAANQAQGMSYEEYLETDGW